MTEKDDLGGMKELLGSANASFGPTLVHMMASENIPYTTDCERCIYYHEEKYMMMSSQKKYHFEGNRMVFDEGPYTTRRYCDKEMRMSKPICPLFDDGKDVKG